MSNRRFENIPTVILDNNIILPQMKASLEFNTKKIMPVLDDVFKEEIYKLFVVLRKNYSPNYDIKAGLFNRGIIVEVLQSKTNEHSTNLVVKGIVPAELEDIRRHTKIEDYFLSDIVEVDVNYSDRNDDYEAVKIALLESFKKYVMEAGMTQLMEFIPGLDSLSLEELINHICIRTHISYIFVQQLLEIDNSQDRAIHLIKKLEILSKIDNLNKEIRQAVDQAIKKTQKDYFIREQIRALRKELGEDDPTDDYDKYMGILELLDLPKDTSIKIKDEIKKLKSYVGMTPEASIQKNYLETIFKYPWNKSSKEDINIYDAKDILDKDHFGLTKVKERILEFLAIKMFNPEVVMPIICLVGPPGTGKTSIAKSIAKALNRELVRISLGGVKDESEIRGHRRTYIGAMPGRIVKGMIQAGVNNPIMLFDEIDKLSSSFNGDPASALLEVFDYEQNTSFRDNYFEVPIDLSNVLFITTANSLSTIPLPLLDRMEVIEVNSYTSNEKFHIAKEYLYPKQLIKCGLNSNIISVNDTALKCIINDYIREAGVRKLERKIAELLRRGAKHILDRNLDKLSITKKNIKEFLGNPRYLEEMLNFVDSIGIVNGLAWTSVGGSVLQIEVNISEGKGDLKLTGQMGDVMKESAIIAKSYLMALKGKYSPKEEFFSKNDIHIHIPEGAVPKDGPSAGITMASAMLSAILNKPACANLCMTGEITLRGRVLPIGGLKEKLLAAKTAKISNALVPFANKKDVEELDEEIIQGLNIYFVKTMDDVIKHLFVD